MTVAALVVAGGLAWGKWQFGQIERADVDLTASPLGTGRPVNFLIVGSDSRENVDPDDPDAGGMLGGEDHVGQRADTIVVARLDPEAGTAELLAIPRDLWIPANEQRINAAYNDGPQELIDTIEQELEVPVHHYVEVDFGGFKDVVDELGGVPIYLEDRVRDRQLGLYIEEDGCVTLPGPSALAYTRSRHMEYSNGVNWVLDPTGDIGRIARQQHFMARTLDRAASLGLTDVGRLPGLISTLADTVSIDGTLTFDDLVDLAKTFRTLSSGDLTSFTLPAVPGETPGGASILRLEPALAHEVLNGFRDEPLDTPVGGDVLEASDVTVAVLNGTGTPEEATNTGDAFAAAGFAVGDLDDADEPVEATTVRYGSGADASALLVSRYLKSAPSFELDPDLGPEDVVVVTGPDIWVLASALPAEERSLPGPGGDGDDGSEGGSEEGEGSTPTTAPEAGLTEQDGVVGIAMAPPGETC